MRRVATSPALPPSERLCRRQLFIVTTGRGPRQGCVVPPILPRPFVSLTLHYDHDKIGTPTPRFAAATRSCDPDPARSSARTRLKRTDGGSHAHADRTHPGMARRFGKHPGGDSTARDARTGTPGGSQADPQAQAALGRVTSDGAALPPRYRHVSRRLETESRIIWRAIRCAVHLRIDASIDVTQGN